MTMRSGSLKQRILIEYPDEQNLGGEIVVVWMPFLEAYSSIVPKRGKEQYTSSEVYASLTHTISLRYKEGITSKMRVKYGARTFEIIAPPVDVRELNKTIELYCKEWEGDVL